MEQAQVNRQYAEQISVFNSPKINTAINYLLAEGFSLGSIIATILSHLPDILTAMKSGNPLAILALLLGLLGRAPAAPVPSAKIGK